jgi:hypothetical protein
MLIVIKLRDMYLARIIYVIFIKRFGISLVGGLVFGRFTVLEIAYFLCFFVYR